MIFDNLKRAGAPADPTPRFTCHFNRGAFLQIDCDVPKNWDVTFRNARTGEIVHRETILSGMWVKTNLRYFIDYEITVNDGNQLWDIKMDLEGKRVVIELGSAAIGDTLAWMPYVEEFRKLNECEVICYTFHNDLLHYPEITFVEPGTELTGIYAWYELGWFYQGDAIDRDYHPWDPKAAPLQQTAASILGSYVPVRTMRPSLSLLEERPRPLQGRYVCIAPHSTAQAKYWNHPDGWFVLVGWLREQGLEVVNLSREGAEYMHNLVPAAALQPPDYDLATIRQYLQHCEYFVGVGSGLSWLSWAMNVKTVLISGFSERWTEIPHSRNVVRIGAADGCCSGCFNWVKLGNDGDWNWCPRFKGTERQFECTKSIKPLAVIAAIEESCK